MNRHLIVLLLGIGLLPCHAHATDPWLTYKEPSLGVSFQYRADWINPIKYPNDMIMVALSIKDEVSIRISFPRELTLDQTVKAEEAINKKKLVSIDIASAHMGGMTGKRFTSTRDKAAVIDTCVQLPQRLGCVGLTGHSLAGLAPYRKDYEKLVSSVQFMPPDSYATALTGRSPTWDTYRFADLGIEFPYQPAWKKTAGFQETKKHVQFVIGAAMLTLERGPVGKSKKAPFAGMGTESTIAIDGKTASRTEVNMAGTQLVQIKIPQASEIISIQFMCQGAACDGPRSDFEKVIKGIKFP